MGGFERYLDGLFLCVPFPSSLEILLRLIAFISSRIPSAKNDAAEYHHRAYRVSRRTNNPARGFPKGEAGQRCGFRISKSDE